MAGDDDDDVHSAESQHKLWEQLLSARLQDDCSNPELTRQLGLVDEMLEATKARYVT